MVMVKKASVNMNTDEVENLAAAFDAKADEFKDVLKMGRTQLQDAIPMTLGMHKLDLAAMRAAADQV